MKRVVNAKTPQVPPVHVRGFFWILFSGIYSLHLKKKVIRGLRWKNEMVNTLATPILGVSPSLIQHCISSSSSSLSDVVLKEHDL